MNTHFEKELADLKEKLLLMAGYAESAVKRAVEALVTRDSDLAARVRQDDAILDRFEKEVDEMAILLLAKAPLASNLRLITIAMKVSQNLERIGDEARKISNRARDLTQEAPLKFTVEIPRLANLALEMLKSSLDAFVNQDPAAARALIPRDREVDALNKQIYRELAAHMMQSPDTIARCLHLMVAAKSLERIADHATNVAEETVYLCEAQDIRHPRTYTASATT
ncbi:MAG: phosphate transport system regulatory protein PhoU [Verrucomicrobia bacterium]|nr:MAG: phosphate transport system regulatory protein PhoU [Verrucomicrobiota bacterium]